MNAVQSVTFVGNPDGVVLIEFHPPLKEKNAFGKYQSICAIADLSTPGLVKEAVNLVKTHAPGTPVQIAFEGQVPHAVTQETIGLFGRYSHQRNINVSYLQ